MKDAAKVVRRIDIWTAETVQYGVALRSVIGADEARRYVQSQCVPLHVVERVLSGTGLPRRFDPPQIDST
jgi:hypothetical protein